MARALSLKVLASALLWVSLTQAPPDHQESDGHDLPVVLLGASGERLVLAPAPLTPGEARKVAYLDVGQVAKPAQVDTLAGGNTFPPLAPTPTNWRGCGLFDDESQFVASYTRLRVSTKIPRGSVATLSCGNAKYGYRHILANHMDDWTRMGSRAGGVPWRGIAGWSMAWTLRDPDQASSSGTRFCYSRKVFLYRKSDGKLVFSQDVRVALGETGRMLITAYPSTRCGGTNLVD